MIQKILGIIKPFLPLAVTGAVILCCAAAPALAEIPARKSAPDSTELNSLLQQIEDVRAEQAAAQAEEAAAEPSTKPKKSKDTDPVVAETLAAGVGDYEDGVYTGSGTGYGGTISVQVTVKDAQITDITILSASGETDSFFSRAKNIIPNIITAQTWEVDAISGATYSSSGIKAAVKNALTGEVTVSTLGSTQNTGNTLALTQVVYEEPSGYIDGVYTGTAQGFGGMITVEVTIADGQLTGLQVVSAPGETSAYLSLAMSALDSVLSAQSPNVDTVAGATYSSSGIINAVKNALSAAKAEDSADDQEQLAAGPASPAASEPETETDTAGSDDPDQGDAVIETTTETYTGSAVVSPDEDEDFAAYGITATVTVTQTVKTTIDGTTKTVETTRRVTGVTVSGASGSNAVYTGRALSGMQASLISSGTADTVAGATCSSAGIRAAYAAAISGAGLGTTTEISEIEAPTEPSDAEEAADPDNPEDVEEPADTDEPADADETTDAEDPADTDENAGQADPAAADGTADTDEPADADKTSAASIQTDKAEPEKAEAAEAALQKD